jgi:hypothetical protein
VKNLKLINAFRLPHPICGKYMYMLSDGQHQQINLGSIFCLLLQSVQLEKQKKTNFLITMQFLLTLSDRATKVAPIELKISG